MRFDSPKRRRRTFTSHDPMASQLAKEYHLYSLEYKPTWYMNCHQRVRKKLYTFKKSVLKEKLEEMKLKYGREICVLESSSASVVPSDASDEPDDFFDLTPEDYHLIMSVKKEDKVLKTRKIREAEEAARKFTITKAVIRVRFPDNHTLEATFHPSEPMQSLVDLLKRVVAQPDMPFYIYTTPPKKLVMDLSQNFHSAGFVPGAIVYFSYDVPKGDYSAAISGPFLKEEVLSLKDFDFAPEQVEPSVAAPANEITVPPPTTAPVQKPAGKKPVKPKWLKM